MSAWLIALTTVIYAGVALDQGLQQKWAMCVVYTGYAFANVGLWHLAKA